MFVNDGDYVFMVLVLIGAVVLVCAAIDTAYHVWMHKRGFVRQRLSRPVTTVTYEYEWVRAEQEKTK